MVQEIAAAGDLSRVPSGTRRHGPPTLQSKSRQNRADRADKGNTWRLTRTQVTLASMARLRFQFSLRSLLVATAAVGFMTAEALIFPDWLAALAGVFGTVAAAAFATITVIYGHTAVRIFAIGALFPLGWMLLVEHDTTSYHFFHGPYAGFISHWNSIGASTRHPYVLGWLFSILLGTACLGFRQFLEPCRDTPARDGNSLDAPPNDD